jgi:hypothetical protein
LKLKEIKEWARDLLALYCNLQGQGQGRGRAFDEFFDISEFILPSPAAALSVFFADRQI